MPNNARKYILTGVILGSIAAVSAGLIALTNFISKDKIKQNELDKVNAGIAEIFGEGSKVKSEQDLSDYKYVVHSYEVVNSGEEFLGYAFKTEGSNMYGKIALIAGFNLNKENLVSFISLSLIKNEQTYASTLVNKYIDPVNDKERDISEVNCGATYGAKLVRDMVDEASKVATSFFVGK